MGKAKAKGKQVKGRMKESAGKAMGDRGMQAEGRGEQIAALTQEAAASRRPGEEAGRTVSLRPGGRAAPGLRSRGGPLSGHDSPDQGA